MKKQALALHRHIAALNAAFSDGGFRARLEMGGQSYRQAAATIPDYHIYSPLDDHLADMDGRMLWVGIEDARGRLVAIEAGRAVTAPAKDGGLNAILNAGIFGRVLPVISRMPPVNLSGRLAYLGGAWVSPSLRGRRIMSLALKLTVAHLARCFAVDSVFGFVRSHHVGQALAAEGYGFTSATAVDLMYLPGEAAADTLCMVWTDRDILAERWAGPPEYRLAARPAGKSAGAAERRSDRGKGRGRP